VALRCEDFDELAGSRIAAIAEKFTVQTRQGHVVCWEYRKIPLNEHPRSGDDIGVLCDAGENRWELVTILSNNVAYLKRPRGEPYDPDGDDVE
jgi:hypothetical protein